MANYATLKAAIQAAIKQNGNQEITGPVLQAQLLNMVNSLGAGYQYAGIATPSTDPGTPDQKVFYIASTPGTYTNFSNLVVADNEVAVLTWDETWAKQTTGAGSAEEVDQLANTVEMLSQIIDKKTFTTSDGFVNMSGAIAQSAGFVHTSQIVLNPGEKLYVYGRGYSTAVAMVAIQNSDSSFTPVVLSVDSTTRIYSYINSSDEVLNIVCSFYSSPDNKIWAINVLDSSLLSILLQHFKDIYKDLGDYSKTELSITAEETGKFIGPAGNVLTSSGFAYSMPFIVQKGQAVELYARGYGQSVAMISKMEVAGERYEVKVVSIDSNAHTYFFIAPETAFYSVSYATNITPVLRLVDSAYLHDIVNKIKSVEILNCDKSSKKVVGLSLTDNKFINFEGGVGSSNGFAYTSKFFVEKGQTIVVLARGYSTGVAMIAKVINENVSYTPVVLSIDSNTHQYYFTSQEDAYYAVSYGVNTGAEIYIVDGINVQQPDSDERMLFAGVPKIGIIGDSLASGAGYNPNTETVSDNINFAWWKVWQRDGGNDYVRLCAGGMSARSFSRNSHSSGIGLSTALLPENKCQLYIIGLEVNDRSAIYPHEPTYLGSPSDIDLSNPENNADTFYGDYAYIIQKITAQNANAKFIVFTNPRTDGDFNNAIRYMATIFSNCYLCDLWGMYSALFVSGGYYAGLQDQSAHYPAMAYQSMGKLLEMAVCKVMNDNLAAFKNIQYN